MSDFVVTLTGEVGIESYDRNNHMNIVHYLKFFDQATFCFFEKTGFTEEFISKSSLSIVAGKILTNHKKEMFLGDKFTIKSGFISYDSSSFIITNRMYRNSTLVAVSDMTMCVIDLITRDRTQVPEEILRQCQAYLIPGLKNPFLEF